MATNSTEVEDKTVVNLSTFPLTAEHISLLKRGLKFCPTPAAPDAGQLREDMDRYHNRLRQIAFFEERNTNLSTTTQSFTNLTLPQPPPDPMGTLTAFKNRKFQPGQSGIAPQAQSIWRL